MSLIINMYFANDSMEVNDKIIISLLRDLGKMSEENPHNECKFLGHERPLGLE